MTPFVYVQSRPDFFRPLQKDEYEQQVARLLTLPAQACIGFSEKEGFIHLSLVDKVIEIVKGLLGFEDKGHSKRVDAEWLKFLYYSEAHGFLTETHLDSLRNRFSFGDQTASPAIRRAFEEMARTRHGNNQDRLSRLRVILIDFHAQQAHYLQPNLWKRLLQKPDLDTRQLIHFGDTSLVLAQQALLLPQPNVQLALKHLLEAQKVKNLNPEFQRTLALQFKQLVETHRNDNAISGYRIAIQQAWIEFARVAYANNRQIEAHEYAAYVLESNPSEEIQNLLGGLFLSVSDFGKLEPFLPALQQAYAQHANLQVKIGKAYWHYQRFAEGVVAYQTAIRVLEQQDLSILTEADASSLQADLHTEIGKAYVQRLEGLNNNDSPSKAISHLSQANQLKRDQASVQSFLLDAYHQQWQAHPETFTARYREEWLQTLQTSSPELIHEKRESIIGMLLACSEQAFARHDNHIANEYLETGSELLEDSSFVLQTLELTLKYNDFEAVNDLIEIWEETHYSNPFIQERIGDVYSIINRNQAISFYQKAIDLFEGKLQRINDVQEEANCKNYLAGLQAKIGRIQLETIPGFFTQVPYDNAITRLETAVSFNASGHTQTLFETYLAAARAEQEKSFLSYDRAKAANYYARAFRLTQQNGPYLNELMALYLSHRSDYVQAAVLFSDIQKLPWANEFQLSDVQLHQLAHQFIASNQDEMALVCLEKAHTKQPLDVYKRDLYQLIHKQAKELQEKAAISPTSAEKIQLLRTAINMLKKQFDDGFTQIETLETNYRKALSSAFRQMAHAFMEMFALDEPEKILSRKSLLKPHLGKFQEEIKNAINSYTSALQYTPEDPSLYFERGMIYDLTLDLDEALQDYRCAVQYNRHNPFYRKRLAFIYGVLAKTDKMEEHNKKVKAPTAFDHTYQCWFDDYFVKNKSQQINPHTL
ncbi:Conserved hypothetical protein [Candidatus Protochlamydia naegleriophila]|uniref:Tetratricopeptide repeat protein n=1 Tax=Candidatus Protochlamydia naegleriophila TaxID=389348 RepID=A0A0U5JG50_9BACT|nr:hypothetical protein [Candidatus Protochlamydia naegleriophila]CUI17850.1 Conserved hypothetical protein [Candidatus Protochlamydia naegleriophila]